MLGTCHLTYSSLKTVSVPDVFLDLFACKFNFYLYFCSRININGLMTSFALNNLWAYLQGLSLSQNDREWLANKLIMPKETNLVEDDNARLDEALAKFSGDFGGSADAMTIAEELRQGAEMVKEVETW